MNMTTTEIRQNKADFIALQVSRPTWGESWRKYYEKKTLTAARLIYGELVEIEKKHMKTDFCFGYGMNGADFDDEAPDAWRAAKSCRDSFPFFLSENLEDTKKTLKWLRKGLRNINCECEWNYLVVVTTPVQTFVSEIDRYSCYWGYRSEEEIMQRCDNQAEIRRLSVGDIRLLIAAYKAQLADIAKRCKSYWKRYGGSKLNTWAYLRD